MNIIQLMLMLSEQVKGFIRKATQSFPITCVDCVDDDSLISMNIEGNCFQDGIPTFDVPIEIQSVGERTVNLLPYPYAHTTKTVNGITFTDNGDGTITANGTSDASAYFQFNYGSAGRRTLLKAGTYKISGNPLNASLGVLMHMYLYETQESASSSNIYTPVNDETVTFTIDSDMYYYWYISITSGTTVDNATFSPMLRKADTEDNGYEPYGYKIPIVAETENLFDLSLVHKDLRDTLYSASGVSAWGGGVMTTNNVHTIIRPGKTYTLSYDMECLKLYDGDIASVTTGLSVHSATSGHIFSQAYLRRRMTIGEKVHISVTATIPDNFDEVVATMLLYTGYYRDDAGNIIPADTIRFTNIKIEEEDHETEPIVSNVYLKEPLRAVNQTYKDVLDVKKGECTRNIKENDVIIESKVIASNLSVGIYTPSDKIQQSHAGVKSEKSLYSRTIKENCLTENRVNFVFTGSADDTLETLQSKYNGSKIVYVLAEPITEKIIAPDLPTFKHGTTYSIATAVQPLSGTVEYYSTTKGE